MGRACGVIGLFKENKVARTSAFRGNVGAHAPQPLRAQPAEAPMLAAVVVDIRNEAGAVEGGGGRAAAPDVRVAQILFRFLYNCGELFIRQCLRGYLVLLILGVVVPVHIRGIGEQVGAVAQHAHIHGVHGELIVGHDMHRHMGEVEVFQLHMADIPGVGNLRLVLVALQVAVFVCVVADMRFGAVSGFRGDGFR